MSAVATVFSVTRGVRTPWRWLMVLGVGALPPIDAVAGEPMATAPPSCVEVSINQRSVLAFDCLSRALAPGDTANPMAKAPAIDAVALEPSNRQVGQYNFSALSHRMGNNLGKSVFPQWPSPTYPSVPLLHPSAGH
ncbi:hypothetical protein [Dyella koreensis]|uniref:Uncharacterized protein n=1 Tax=Dyella koreensis TaxID=311235 RepID=A0ABW8K935_9GAMM